MVNFKVYTIELNRVIKSVKKGIDKTGSEELRGIRFQVVNDELIAYTSDGYKVFTNKLKIIEKSNVPENFEFISPIIRFPSEYEDAIIISVSYDDNIVEYDFGKSKQSMQLYTLNSDMQYIKSLLNKEVKHDAKMKIVFNVNNLKSILDGFDKKENVMFSIKADNSLVLIESVSDERNKRLIMPCLQKKEE